MNRGSPLLTCCRVAQGGNNIWSCFHSSTNALEASIYKVYKYRLHFAAGFSLTLPLKIASSAANRRADCANSEQPAWEIPPMRNPGLE